MTLSQIGAAIRAARIEKKLRQDDLAAWTGLNVATISAVENGRRASKMTMNILMGAVGLELDLPDGLAETGSRIKVATIPTLKRWKFEPGRGYYIGGKKLRFLRDVGMNHLFQSSIGWLTCWTDAQLVGVEVKE